MKEKHVKAKTKTNKNAGKKTKKITKDKAKKLKGAHGGWTCNAGGPGCKFLQVERARKLKIVHLIVFRFAML